MSLAPAHPDRSFPRLHPRPATGWLNDPNGIHHFGKRWHVFFQYNPDSTRHQHITWGHVSSPDLVHWDDHGIAIRPQPGADDAYGCWTGVGILDQGIRTLIYSGVRADNGRSSVMLAHADGDGWTQSPHVAAGMPADPSVVQVRDPFLFTLAGRRWGIQGAGLASGTPTVLLYDVSDLTSWQYLGTLINGNHELAEGLPPANVWECPQLVRTGDDWVLIVSLWLEAKLTRVAYFVGSLVIDPNSGNPVFTPRSAGLFDDGPCLYAPQAVQAGVDDEGPERVLVWGWGREVAAEGVLGRSEEDGDAVGWSGLLTSPRELVVEGDAVFTQPARELRALRAEPIHDQVPDQAELRLTGHGAVELWLTGEVGPGQLIYSGKVAGSGLTILLDASLIEVFPDKEVSTTLRAYPSSGEHYRLVTGPGVTSDGWALHLVAGTVY